MAHPFDRKAWLQVAQSRQRQHMYVNIEPQVIPWIGFDVLNLSEVACIY